MAVAVEEVVASFVEEAVEASASPQAAYWVLVVDSQPMVFEQEQRVLVNQLTGHWLERK